MEMSEEESTTTDASPASKPVQGILGVFWAGGQGLPLAAENGQGALSPQQPDEWLARYLTSGTLESRPLVLERETLEHLLTAVLEWGSQRKGVIHQPHHGVPEPAQSSGIEARTGQRRNYAAAESKPALTINTFGRFTIYYQGQEIAPPPRHGEALCKALLCQAGRQAEFVWLADRLWPEAEADQAMQYLYVASNAVRSTLPRAVLLTHRQTQIYQLVGQEHLWVDADAALALVARAEALGRTTREAVPLLEEAMSYFRRGRYLCGVEESWAYARRRFLETRKERALVWLVEAYRGQDRHEQAEAVLLEALTEDPLNENLLRCLLLVLHEAGMTHQALCTYEEFVRGLRKVGREPTEATTALYAQLKRAPQVRELPPLALAVTAPAPVVGHSLLDQQSLSAGSDEAGEPCWPVRTRQQMEALLALLKPLILKSGSLSEEEFEQLAVQELHARLAHWGAWVSFEVTTASAPAE